MTCFMLIELLNCLGCGVFQETLLEFLKCSKLMLTGTESVLTMLQTPCNENRELMSSLPLSGGGSLPNALPTAALSRGTGSRVLTPTKSEDNLATRAPDSNKMSTMWMSEMQREFNELVDIVMPLLRDIYADAKPCLKF